MLAAVTDKDMDVPRRQAAAADLDRAERRDEIEFQRHHDLMLAPAFWHFTARQQPVEAAYISALAKQISLSLWQLGDQ